MRPVELERKRRLRNEFIKSGAILLLAIVLLITAVFAWFGDKTKVSIEPFYLSVRSEQDGTELGQNIITEKSVILPAATKLGDTEISVADFSKAIRVMPLEVESPLNDNVSISIVVPKGLHYYIDTDYVADSDTVLSYSQTINNNHTADTGNDEDAILVYTSDDYYSAENVYKHMVAIVFWADYHYVDEKTGKTYGQIIDEDGELNLNALMSFKIVMNTGER